MKKVLMLAALILGTSAMVNAETLPLKKATAKETSIAKNRKHKKVRKAKTQEAKKEADSKR